MFETLELFKMFDRVARSIASLGQDVGNSMRAWVQLVGLVLLVQLVEFVLRAIQLVRRRSRSNNSNGLNDLNIIRVFSTLQGCTCGCGRLASYGSFPTAGPSPRDASWFYPAS